MRLFMFISEVSDSQKTHRWGKSPLYSQSQHRPSPQRSQNFAKPYCDLACQCHALAEKHLLWTWVVTSDKHDVLHGALFGHLWAHCDPFGLEWLRGKRHQEKRRRQKLPQRTWAGVVWDCACMISQMQVPSFLIYRQHSDISDQSDQFFFRL